MKGAVPWTSLVFLLGQITYGGRVRWTSERRSAHSDSLSEEVQKTCQCWLLTFGVTVPSPFYIVSQSVFYNMSSVKTCLTYPL